MLRGVLPLFLLVASLGVAQADPPGILELYGQPQQGPRVQSNQQPDASADGQAQGKGDQTETVGAPPTSQLNEAVGDQKQGRAQRSNGAEEPSEYWTVLRWRLKITDTLLAVFTFFLVVVGGVQGFFLWRTVDATLIAANAADLSARAAIGMELPIIRSPRYPGLLPLKGPPTDSDFDQSGAYSQIYHQYNIAVGFSFRNLGRTPAMPFEMKAGWMVASILPPEPVYLATVECLPTDIIRADGEDFMPPRIRKAIELTSDDQEALRAKTALLWLYISLHYRDFLDHPHEARFCWRGYGSFGLRGGAAPPPAYTAKT